MDAIHSWIDEEEVNRLAKTLSVSPERMKEWKKLDAEGFAMTEKQGQLSNETIQPTKQQSEVKAEVKSEGESEE